MERYAKMFMAWLKLFTNCAVRPKKGPIANSFKYTTVSNKFLGVQVRKYITHTATTD